MTREMILQEAYALFEAEGIQNMRMRKIAEKLGIDKKELCEYFPDKRELVWRSVEYGIGRLDNVLEDIGHKFPNPVEILVRTAVTAFDAFSRMQWAFVEDVEGCPAAIDIIHDERYKIQKNQPIVFRQAVEEGYMRGEAYYNLLLRFFWEQFMAQGRTRDEAMRVLFSILRGVATEKGWRKIELIQTEMNLQY